MDSGEPKDREVEWSAEQQIGAGRRRPPPSIQPGQPPSIQPVPPPPPIAERVGDRELLGVEAPVHEPIVEHVAELDPGSLDLIEPAEPPTPPPIEIESLPRTDDSTSGRELPPLTIEPSVKREGQRAITVESMDIVIAEEMDSFARLPVTADPIGPPQVGVAPQVAPLTVADESSLDSASRLDSASLLDSASRLDSARESGVARDHDPSLLRHELDDALPPELQDGVFDEPRLTANADTILTSLHAFLEQELDAADGDDRRLRALLLYEMGHLEELVYHDGERSLRRYEFSLEQDDGFVPTLRALRRRYAQSERWRDYVHVLRAEVDVCQAERDRAVLLALLGEAEWRRLQQTDSAIEHLQAALALVPRNRRALEVLRAIFSEAQRWEDLLAVLRQMANITTDSIERARLTVEMAELSELRLGKSSEAEELYAQALGLDPTNEKALIALRRLYLLHRRWQRLSELLAREAGQDYEPSEKFANLYRAARIAEMHLHDDARAASLLETAVALRPVDALPLQALEEVYQRTGRAEDLGATLARQARIARDPALRADLFYRLGQLYQDWLGRPEKAIEIYRQALKEQPQHDATLRALAELYERIECWVDLLDVELLRAERQQEEGARADGYLRAARICEHHLKDMQRAVDLYERVWRIKRGQLEAFRALDRLYRESNRWEALAQICDERAQLTSDPGLSAALLREAAAIYEERLDQRESAMAALERLRQAQPLDRQALMHLARLYELASQPEKLRGVLEQWAELSKDSHERAELRRRLAELLEHTLRYPEAAAAIYREMLVTRPEDNIARERLKGIYERTGRWHDLVDLLRTELHVCGSPLEEAVLLLRIGRINEDKLGELAKAQSAYEQALARDSSCTPASVALEELLRRSAAWEPLVALLERQAERVNDTLLSAAALSRAAEVCEEMLATPKRAIELYARALELDSGSETARQGLERIYLTLDDVAALESHYLREAEELTNPQLRVRAYLRLAGLFDRGSNESDTAAAADAYEAALRIVSDQPDALHGLAALCRRRGQWQRLAELLGHITEHAGDREAALTALKEWAAILETHPAGDWDMTPIYERVLDSDPQDLHAIAALERLAYERKDGDALIRLAMLQVETSSEKSWIAALCMRAALISVATNRPQEGVELLRRTLVSAPRYLPAIRLLRRLQEQLGNYAEVSEWLLREAEQVSSELARRAALYRAAVIKQDHLDDVVSAQRILEQVVAADPHHAQAFERLASILHGKKQWRSLVELYRRRLAALEPTERPMLQLELAVLYRDRLEDASAAIQVLSDLLSIEGDFGPALDHIASLCEAQGRWREAEEYLNRLAGSLKEDPELRRRAFFRRVDLLSQQLGEEDRALQALQELLRRERGDREALIRVVEICRRQGDWDRTVRALEDLARSGLAVERVGSLIELAEVSIRSLNEPQRASSALRDAAALCLDNPDALSKLAAFFERRGDFEGYIKLLGVTLRGLPPEGSPGAVSMRLARSRILSGRLLRPDEAEQEVREALRMDPVSIEARLELAGLFLWGDRLDEAAQEYRRALDQDPLSVAGYRGLYRVYERKGDLSQASESAQVVCALSQASETERALADQLEMEIEAALAAPSMVLDPPAYWRLLAEGEVPIAAFTLLRALADYIPQLGLAELEPSGPVVSSTAIEPQSALALRCAVLARVLGAEVFACELAQGLHEPVELRPLPRLQLVLDAEFALNAPAGEFRFVVGRAAAEVVTRSAYLRLLSERTVALMLAAAVEPFERGFGQYLAAPGELEAMVRQLGRVVPRKARRALEQPARAYLAEGPLDLRHARALANQAAARAGMLLAGNISSVLAVLDRERADRRIKTDLLKFAVSPQLYEVRRRLTFHSD